MRLQSMSFFLFGFILCSLAVMLLWNFLRRDFPMLPRLSFARAAAAVFLWGLLFILVLTMIGGARELMTPGAWKQNGITYQLRNDETPPAPTNRETLRRQHLERLRIALWQFAATHQGHFPNADEVAAIDTELWQVPGTGGMRYVYVPNLTAGQVAEVLASEPELEPGKRLVLKTNGDIVLLSTAEFHSPEASHTHEISRWNSHRGCNGRGRRRRPGGFQGSRPHHFALRLDSISRSRAVCHGSGLAQSGPGRNFGRSAGIWHSLICFVVAANPGAHRFATETLACALDHHAGDNRRDSFRGRALRHRRRPSGRLVDEL